MANIIIRNVFSLKSADKLISGAEYEEKKVKVEHFLKESDF